MRTEDLIEMLAKGPVAVEPGMLARRYATALGWGAFGATLLMAVLLGVRPDIDQAARLPMFWVKVLFPLALAAAALVALMRLSRPGAKLGRVPAALAAPVLAIWAIAAASLLGVRPALRAELIFGDTWWACLVNVPLLSAPGLVAVLWAVKGYAPTRPAVAGAAAGLLAGALGAAIYALHCPELAAPFIAVWYVLGILVPTAFGAIVGARLLRW